ncbi:MAG TPA: hypothetical protein VG320_01655 [Paraburkholderia sp.]|uniref:hypothetical protein n=1 Tax=Paraburkholderia sp. TaxID=1926495 RepID=UPI002DEDD934|nr:hypothetical protein [Paraburkholderia sp.]
MKKQEFRFYPNGIALSDVRIRLGNDVGSRDIPLDKAGVSESHVGRSLVVVEYVSSLAESSINNYDISNCNMVTYQVAGSTSGEISFDSELIDIDLSKIASGGKDIELNIFDFVESPMIGKSAGVTEDRLAMLRLSDMQIFYVIFCEEHGGRFAKNDNPCLYESYSHHGFIAVDVDSFNGFLREKLGPGRHDLVEKFTTTEIANELFASGLMILCWGITPWVYTLMSSAEENSFMAFPDNDSVACSGQYVFSGRFEKISIVPGSALSSWDVDHQENWPKLHIGRGGDVVKLELRVPMSEDVGSGNIIPFPYFNFRRVIGEISESNPILSFNIFDGV